MRIQSAALVISESGAPILRAAASSWASQLSVLSPRPWRKWRKQRTDIWKSRAASKARREENCISKFVMTGARQVAEILDEGMTLACNQTRDGFFAQAIEKLAIAGEVT